MKKVYCILVLFALPVWLLAQPQSENYRITKQVIDAGGGASSSANFQLYSAFGQPTPVGVQSSESYVLYAGYLTPTFAVSPLSPIQTLVITPIPPSTVLCWQSIPGANSYKIYRDLDPRFTPETGNLIDTVSDTTFTDTNALGLPLGKYFYIVTASTESIMMGAAPQTPPSSRKNQTTDQTRSRGDVDRR
jgi:hypothetical protein